MKKLLGQYLLDRGGITPEQLKEALECQVVFGGRLGSILVELEYVTLEELEEYLVARTGIPLPPETWLTSPTKDAIEALSRDVVEKYRSLPLHIEGRKVHVAMLDPQNPAFVDDVSFAAGLRVQAYTLSEQRLDHWLKKRYGIERVSKSIVLDQKTGWGRFKKSKTDDNKADTPERNTPAPIGAMDGPSREDLAALGIGSLGAGEELTPSEDGVDVFAPPEPEILEIGGDELEALADPVPESVPEPAPTPSPVADVPDVDLLSEPELPDVPVEAVAAVPKPTAATAGLHELQGAQSDSDWREWNNKLEAAAAHDDVVVASLHLARRFGRVAAYLRLKDEKVEGYRGAGAGLDGRLLDSIAVEVSEDTLLRDPAQGRAWIGSHPANDIDKELFQALHKNPESQVVFCPIRKNGTVVAILYVDYGKGAFPSETLAELARLSDRISEACTRVS